MTPRQDDRSPSTNRIASVRKLEANRRNALKSTGPRTPRGKRFSRRNALKHGFFIRDREAGWGEQEPQEFPACYKRLLDELQPVGPCEEFEVEYIALCWLRLQRLWRYENAEVEAANTSVARNQEEGLYHPWANSPTRATQMSLLRTAEKEAEVNGQISPELMKNIFAENFYIQSSWPYYEAEAEKIAQKKRHDIALRIAQERKISLSESKTLLARDPKALPERQRFVAVETVRAVIRGLVEGWHNRSRFALQNEYQRQLIPNDCEVDKIIRYGTAFERQLSRSYDRLDRLQRRRRGELVPPPVSVRLTR